MQHEHIFLLLEEVKEVESVSEILNISGRLMTLLVLAKVSSLC